MKGNIIYKFFIILFLVIFIQQISFAAGTKEKVALSHMYGDDLSYTMSNIEKHKDGLLLFGAVLGGSFLADRGTKSYTTKHQNSTLHNTADFLNTFGKGYYMFPAATLLGVSGYYAKDDKLLNASITSMESGITAGLLSVGLKTITGRERPYATGDPFVFHSFSLWSDRYHSFPSGDVTIAWSMITPYAVYYHEPLLYLLPLGVNFARVYKNKHWVSDTVFGSGLGFATGYLFSESHLFKNVTFTTDGRNIGIIYRFK